MEALLVIDVQKDYFPGGKYVQWDTDRVLNNVVQLCQLGVPTFFIQHIGTEASPFFVPGTEGAELHDTLIPYRTPAICTGEQRCACYRCIPKTAADSFYGTELEDCLSELGVNRLYLCGMMTQNCVTHTAISKTAERYDVTVVGDACTSIDPMIHNIALRALATRVRVVDMIRPGW